MVGTITPIVYRNSRLDWRVAGTIYTLGSILGGGLVGALIGAFGTLLLLPVRAYSHYVPFLTGVFATAYALHELHLISLPHPERKRQVDRVWTHRFHPFLTAGLFGLLLGAGVTTFIPTASYHVLWLAATLHGSPILGALLFACFGAARAAILWPASQWATTFEKMDGLSRYMDLTKPLIRQMNGFGLAVFGAYSLSVFVLGQ